MYTLHWVSYFHTCTLVFECMYDDKSWFRFMDRWSVRVRYVCMVVSLPVSNVLPVFVHICLSVCLSVCCSNSRVQCARCICRRPTRCGSTSVSCTTLTGYSSHTHTRNSQLTAQNKNYSQS